MIRGCELFEVKIRPFEVLRFRTLDPKRGRFLWSLSGKWAAYALSRPDPCQDPKPGCQGLGVWA